MGEREEYPHLDDLQPWSTIEEEPPRESQPHQETPAMTNFEELLIEYGNASFDCGGWREDETNTPYIDVKQECDKARKAVTDEVEQLQQQLAERERELATEKTAHQETQRKLQERDELAGLRLQDNLRLRRELQETERKWKECQEERDQLLGECRYNEEKAIPELQSALTSKEQQLSQAESAIASLKQEYAELNRDYGEMVDKRGRVVRDNETLNQRISELTEALRSCQQIFENNGIALGMAERLGKLLTPELSKAEATVQSCQCLFGARGEHYSMCDFWKPVKSEAQSPKEGQ